MSGEVILIRSQDLDSYRRNRALLIDVREGVEFREKHLAGAINVPYGRDSMDLLKWITKYWKGVVILYCNKGGRSLSAAYEMSLDNVCACSLEKGMDDCQRKEIVIDNEMGSI